MLNRLSVLLTRWKAKPKEYTNKPLSKPLRQAIRILLIAHPIVFARINQGHAKTVAVRECHLLYKQVQSH